MKLEVCGEKSGDTFSQYHERQYWSVSNRRMDRTDITQLHLQ